MHRLALILSLALTIQACGDSHAADTKPKDDITAKGNAIVAEIEKLKAKAEAFDAAKLPRNFVCERVKLADAKAICEPELNGEGELLTHRARVTQETQGGKRTLSCSLIDRALTVECAGLFPGQAEEKPAAKKATAKGAKK